MVVQMVIRLKLINQTYFDPNKGEHGDHPALITLAPKIELFRWCDEDRF